MVEDRAAEGRRRPVEGCADGEVSTRRVLGRLEGSERAGGREGRKSQREQESNKFSEAGAPWCECVARGRDDEERKLEQLPVSETRRVRNALHQKGK
jgi:hypothetical protein